MKGIKTMTTTIAPEGVLSSMDLSWVDGLSDEEAVALMGVILKLG
jgi:hypothetical protein